MFVYIDLPILYSIIFLVIKIHLLLVNNNGGLPYSYVGLPERISQITTSPYELPLHVITILILIILI